MTTYITQQDLSPLRIVPLTSSQVAGLGGAIDNLPSILRDQISPVVADIESRVRREAEIAAKKGATEAVVPLVGGVAVLSLIALLVAIRAGRR